MQSSDETHVIEIIKKYLTGSGGNAVFKLKYHESWNQIHSLTGFPTDSFINQITDLKRSQETGFFSSKEFKLRDELLPYPNTELVFELIPSTSYTNLAVYIIIRPLRIWLENVENQSIYNLVKSNKQFRSKFNNNWILIPPALKIWFKLNTEMESFLVPSVASPAKLPQKKQEVDLISF